MKLEDVFKVLPMLIPNMFVDQLDFNLDANNVPRSYYYLKHLKRVHYDCHG